MVFGRRRHRVPVLIVLAFLSAIVPLGCGAVEVESDRIPEATLPAQLKAVVEQLDAQDYLVVRHNPADCACPAFEVTSAMGPLRTMLQVSDLGSAAFTLLEEAIAAEQRPRSFRVTGRLSSQIFVCGRGPPFIVLNLDSFEGVEPSVLPQSP